MPEGPAATVLELLREAPAGVDELVRRSRLPPEGVGAALVELELEGLAVVSDGVYRATL
jgi:predicted Rossmann fold nucleotide-binding protein DprA/Smf involved in DNA uptake